MAGGADSSARDVPGRLEMLVAGRVTVLLAAQDAVDALVTFIQDMARTPGSLEDLERFLPFAIKLAKMFVFDALCFRRRLEETGMVNGITEMKNEGKAEDQIDEIRRLVAKGRLSVDAARAEIRELVEGCLVSPEIAQKAIDQLG